MPLSAADLRLINAVRARNLPEIRTALIAGANVNCRDDDAGLTPLHIAACNNDLPAVKLLLKVELSPQDAEALREVPSAKTHLINHAFQTPLQYAMLHSLAMREAARGATGDVNNTVMGMLIRHRTAVTLDDINERLGFCLASYKEGHAHADENRALLDYAVSHLTGANIHKLKHHERNDFLIKYESHICSIKGEKKDIASGKSVDLEGFSREEFLPLRLRVFFETLFQIELEIIRPNELPSDLPQDGAKLRMMRQLLQEELLNGLDTLHICQLTKVVTFNPPPADPAHPLYTSGSSNVLMCGLPAGAQSAMRKYLVQNIVDRLHALRPGQEFIFAGGWQKHAIYIAFVRRRDDIIVRIDNLGEGCSRTYSASLLAVPKPFHPIHENRESKKTPGRSTRYIYPAVLGSAPLSDFRDNPLLFGYIAGLINAYKEPGERKEAALTAIYDTGRRLLAPQEIPYPSAKMQSVGNCAVKNHQVGLQIRLGSNAIYKWVRREEYKRVHLKELSLAENYHQTYWPLENQLRPVSASEDSLLRECYKSIQFKHLLKREDKVQVNSYVPLDLIRQIIPKSSSETSATAIPETKDNFGMQTSSGNATVKQLLTLETLFQRLPSEKETKPLSRMVISGIAGMGKSTLSLRMAQEWAHGRLWSTELAFKALVLIDLRNLSSIRYPLLSEYDLVDVIYKELTDLLGKTAGAGNVIKRAVIERWINDPDTLWILDGYDEIANATPKQLKKAFKELLARPKLLITSRPEAITSSLRRDMEGCALDAHIELTGFSDVNINHYIEKFFPVRSVSTAVAGSSSELLAFLKTNIGLWGLTHVPVLLEAICYLWSDPNAELNKVATVTQLYQELQYGLLRRYLAKQNIEGLSERELEASCAKELRFLEWVAFQALSTNTDTTVITSELLQDSMEKFYGELPEEKPTLWRDEFKKIVALGVLRDTGTSKKESLLGHSYEFTHLSFHEFFAARFLRRSLQSPQDKNYLLVIEWLSVHKYHPFYQRTLSFLAGLLSANKKALPPLTAFWQALRDEPRDVVSLNHFCLVTRCLQESDCDPSIPQQAAMIAQIVQALNTLVYKPQGSNFLTETLEINWLPILQQSPSLFRHLAVEALLLNGLQDPSKTLATLQGIGTFGVAAATPSVLTALVNGLQLDDRSEVRRACAIALGNFKAAAATLLVLNVLIRSLQTEVVPEVRRQCAVALGCLGAATAPVLTTLVDNLQTDCRIVGSSCARALGHLGAAAATPPVLTALVNGLQHHAKSEVKQLCADALGHLGAAAATPPVLTALVNGLQHHITTDVRRLCADTLGHLGAAAAKEEILTALVTSLQRDSSVAVKISCADALGRLGMMAATQPVLEALVTSLQENGLSPNVRCRCADALGKLGAAAATQLVLGVLVTSLQKDTDDSVKYYCAIAIGRLGAAAATQLVLGVLVTSLQENRLDPDVRRRCADALGKLGAAAATQPVLGALVTSLQENGLSLDMRCRCADALGKLGAAAATQPVLTALAEGLRDTNSDIVDACIDALSNLGAVAAKEPVLSILIEGLKINAGKNMTPSSTNTFGSMTPTTEMHKVSTAWADKRKKRLYAYLLGCWGEAAATPQVLAALLELVQKDEGKVMGFACITLSKLGTIAATPVVLVTLINWLDNEKNRSTNSQIFLALKDIPFSIHRLIKEYLDAPNTGLLLALANFLLIKNVLVTRTPTGFQVAQYGQKIETIDISKTQAAPGHQLLQALSQQAERYALPGSVISSPQPNFSKIIEDEDALKSDKVNDREHIQNYKLLHNKGPSAGASSNNQSSTVSGSAASELSTSKREEGLAERLSILTAYRDHIRKLKSEGYARPSFLDEAQDEMNKEILGVEGELQKIRNKQSEQGDNQKQAGLSTTLSQSPSSSSISFFGTSFAPSSRPTVNGLAAQGDDTNILSHQSNHYWYSLRDATTLIAQIRQKHLSYTKQRDPDEYKAPGGELYSAFRENVNGIFISDPYTIVDSHGLKIRSQLTEDIDIIAGKHEISTRRNRWERMPNTLVIPFLKDSHWRLLRIKISYSSKKFSVLLDDPYGGERFPQALLDEILPVVKEQVARLLTVQAELHPEIAAGTLFTPKPISAVSKSVLEAKEIPYDIYIKSKDQQGAGINGSNCGPVALQNLRDYVRLNYRENEDFTAASCSLYTIPVATDPTHSGIIRGRREEDRRFYQEYYSSKTTTGVPAASSNERLKQQQAAIANTNQKHLDRVKDDKAVRSDLVEKISQLEPSTLGVLFALIDHDRLCGSTNLQAPYTQQELERAFKMISEQQQDDRFVISSK